MPTQQDIGSALQRLLNMAKVNMNIPCNPCSGSDTNFQTSDNGGICNPNFASAPRVPLNPLLQPYQGMPPRRNVGYPVQPPVQPLDYIKANNAQPLYGDRRRLPLWTNHKTDYVYNMYKPSPRIFNPVIPGPQVIQGVRKPVQMPSEMCGYPSGWYVPPNLSVGDQMREQQAYNTTGGNYPMPDYLRRYPIEMVRIPRPIQMTIPPKRGVPTQNNPGNGNCGQYTSDFNLDGIVSQNGPQSGRRGITPVAFPNMNASGEYLGPAVMILPSHLTSGGIGMSPANPRLYTRVPPNG